MEENTQRFIPTKVDAILNIMVAIDCLANASARGNRQSTTSGRIWYNYANPNPDTIHFWVGLKKTVDKAFLHVDGTDHCMRAYNWELDEYHYDARPVDQVLLKVFSYPVCWTLDKVINPVLIWRNK